MRLGLIHAPLESEAAAPGTPLPFVATALSFKYSRLMSLRQSTDIIFDRCDYTITNYLTFLKQPDFSLAMPTSILPMPINSDQKNLSDISIAMNGTGTSNGQKRTL